MKKSSLWTIIIVVVLLILVIVIARVPKEEAPELTAPAKGTEETGEEAGVPEKTETEMLLEKAQEVIPGGSLVTEQGEVITPAGEAVSNKALPGSPQAPQQSPPLGQEEIPEGSVELIVSPSGFEPNEFSVKANAVVTLLVSATEQTHVFKFDDSGLQAVAVGVASNETRAITFNAPEKGDYTFYCDVPGHKGRGESGVMHVE